MRRATSAAGLPGGSFEAMLGLFCGLTSPSSQCCSLPFPNRCWSRECFWTNLVHTNCHLRIHFLGHPPSPLPHNIIFKRKLLAHLCLPMDWDTERVVGSELWPYGWGKCLEGGEATREKVLVSLDDLMCQASHKPWPLITCTLPVRYVRECSTLILFEPL